MASNRDHVSGNHEADGAVATMVETAKMAAATQPHITTDHPLQPTPVPAAPRCYLPDVLPEIMSLAERVGGLKNLAELVQELRQDSGM